MTNQHRKPSARRRLLSLVVPAALALLAGTATPTQASLITFNPSGNGNGAGAIAEVQNFTYSTGNVLAYGINAPPSVGSTYTILYQSVLASVSGAKGILGGAGAGGNFNSTGTEFTVVAGFDEKISSITPVPGSGGTPDHLDIGFSLAAPFTPSTGVLNSNFFRIYAVTAGTSNTSAGTGFAGPTTSLVLSGHLVQDAFSGVFHEDGTISGNTFTPKTDTFNQSGSPSPLDATTSKSTTGSGGTNITVAVDFADAKYFPTPPSFLNFTTTNTQPFTGVTPTNMFYDGNGTAADVVASIGATNGLNGRDLTFQSVAQNSFTVVPEPSSIVLTASALAMGFGFFASKRRNQAR